MANTFERVEKKYLLTEKQWQQLKVLLEPYMEKDFYGLYTICNIYYDTVSYELIRNSLEKPVYKEKLRLRSYGVPKPDSEVFLEIKKKYRGIVYKRRIALPLYKIQEYFKTGIPSEGTYNRQIFSEIDYFVQFYQPKPVLFLAYDRVAYIGREDSEFRLTADKNIRSREEELSLTGGDHGTLLLTEDSVLLEVKVPYTLPLWLASAFSKLKIYPVSFSKYGAVYQTKQKRERLQWEYMKQSLTDQNVISQKKQPVAFYIKKEGSSEETDSRETNYEYLL